MGELRECPKNSGPAAITMIHSQVAYGSGERGDATSMRERRHHGVCQRHVAVIAGTCAFGLSA